MRPREIGSHTRTVAELLDMLLDILTGLYKYHRLGVNTNRNALLPVMGNHSRIRSNVYLYTFIFHRLVFRMKLEQMRRLLPTKFCSFRSQDITNSENGLEYLHSLHLTCTTSFFDISTLLYWLAVSRLKIRSMYHPCLCQVSDRPRCRTFQCFRICR